MPRVFALGLSSEDLVALGAQLGSAVPITGLKSADDLAQRLALTVESCLILVDMREGPIESLRHASLESQRGHQVILWGVKRIDSPQLTSIFCDSDRRVECSSEACIEDVSNLCAAMIGR